jgi:hypothetical protein
LQHSLGIYSFASGGAGAIFKPYNINSWENGYRVNSAVLNSYYRVNSAIGAGASGASFIK